MSVSDEKTKGEIELKTHDIHQPTIEGKRMVSCRNEALRKNFMAEFRNGQRRLGRKCIKRSNVIPASKNGTTNLINHLKIFNLKTSKLSGQQPSVE